MRNYLIFSSSAHFLLLTAFFFLTRGSFTTKAPRNYYIDFIGQGRVLTVSEQTAAASGASSAKTAKAPAVAAKEPSFSRRGEADEPLPPPSILNGSERLIDAGGPARTAETGSPVRADFSDFPYPWYITQVREALWNSWTQRMPSSGMLKCTVRFEIRRNGSVASAGVERSSGNRLFDHAAESSVENAAPFPALPDDFFEDTLTVHVEFKTTE